MVKKASKKMNVLQTAESLIYGDRQKQYGNARENFTDIATGWANIVGIQVSPEQVALMMAWLKICRITAGLKRGEPAHTDSIVDLAGYAGCIEKIQNNE